MARERATKSFADSIGMSGALSRSLIAMIENRGRCGVAARFWTSFWQCAKYCDFMRLYSWLHSLVNAGDRGLEVLRASAIFFSGRHLATRDGIPRASPIKEVCRGRL